MNLIVAVDRRWGIGRDNALLASVPGDMRYFKEKTSGKVVVMGRKTLESLPGHRGLPNRVNIVMTRQPGYTAERCLIAADEAALDALLADYDADEVFVIGGASIYKRLYRRCDTCYVTKLDADLGADRFMVNLDEDPAYRCVWESELQEENGLRYRFTRYERERL